MRTTVNMQQVDNIIQSLDNTVKNDHVGALTEGAVTQTTSTWAQRVSHFFKTLFGSPAVVQENRAILDSYKTMLRKNLGEVYGKLFSDRLRKVEDSGSYTIGKSLSRQLRSIASQYKADIGNSEKVGEAQNRAHALIKTSEFQTTFKDRLDMNLKGRGIPPSYEGILEMKADATRLFCEEASDFILRNDRYPTDDETQKMLDYPLDSVFKDVNRKNCDNLCSNYPFIASDSKDSMDVMLKSDLAKNNIHMDVPEQFVDMLVSDVKDKLRGFRTFVTLEDVKDTISSVIKNAAKHDFIDNSLDKILTPKLVTHNIPPKMTGVVISATMSLTDVLQTIAKDKINTKELETMLRSSCSKLRQDCSELPRASMPNIQQQDELFLLALESAMEFCLLDTAEMGETRNVLLNNSNAIVGARSPFVNMMYRLSNGISANTDADAGLMLKFGRKMIALLNEGITKASAESEPAQIELRNSLKAKYTEFDEAIKRSKQLMEASPLKSTQKLQNIAQEKYKDEIKKYEDTIQGIIKGINTSQRPKEDFDKYVVGLQECINDLKRLGNYHGVKRELKVQLLQDSVTSIQNAIGAFENRIDTLKMEKSDGSDPFAATEATLELMHNELYGKMDELAVAKADLAQQDINTFNEYIKAFKEEDRALLDQIVLLEEEITLTQNAQEIQRSQVELLRAKADDSETAISEMEATTASLQALQSALEFKKAELSVPAAELRAHAETQHAANELYAGITALRVEIEFLQNKVNALPMSKNERDANSTVVRYLAAGKDFGGLVNYNTFQKTHANLQVPNNVGLTHKEKSSLVTYMENGFNTVENKEKTCGVKLNDLIRSITDSIDINLNASEEQHKENLSKMGERSTYRKLQDSTLHKATQHYTQTFVDDFKDGLLVAVNGVIANPTSSHATDEEVAKSFAGLSAMFGSAEIAGKVLNPFTKTSRDALSFTLARTITSLLLLEYKKLLWTINYLVSPCFLVKSCMWKSLKMATTL